MDPVLIVLPPSEGKTPARRGAPVNVEALSHPDLAEHRHRVLDALIEASALPTAAETLGVGASLAHEIERNTRLRTEHAAPASRVYTGVLYAAAGLDDLTGTAKRRANKDVRIISALWGALTPADRIPAYRLSICANLPGLPSLASHWAAPLRETLSTDVGVVIDARSGPYVPAWRPPSGRAWLAIRVVTDTAGVRTVVSHNAKHTRGLFTNHLLTRAAPPPQTPREVLEAARELIPSVLREATLHESKKAPATLELVLA